MVNIAIHQIHHPFVNPQERVGAPIKPRRVQQEPRLTSRIPAPTVVLPGGGRLALYPAVKTRWTGPCLGVGPGMMGMPPHPLAGPLAFGVGTGIDNTAAAWRRYYGLGGWLTGYHCGMRMPGRPGLGGYFGGWDMRD